MRHAAQSLLEHQQILILCHQDPDGDTLGSGFALCEALRGLGKAVKVLCDSFPPQFSFLYPKTPSQVLSQPFVVAVDVADERLLGERLRRYAGNVDLCIDHHPSNTLYARQTLLESQAAATAEILVRLLDVMGVPLTRRIATGLYTGISTDTGCFKFSNTTAQLHRTAARLMETGIDTYRINRRMFDIKSKGRIAIERMVLDTVRYYYGGTCALIYITQEMVEKAGATQAELGTLSSLPRQIEGVEIGVTLRQRGDSFKVSVHTGGTLDAAALCAKLGGGGHFRAAGCVIRAPLPQAVRTLVELIGLELARARSPLAGQASPRKIPSSPKLLD